MAPVGADVVLISVAPPPLLSNALEADALAVAALVLRLTSVRSDDADTEAAAAVVVSFFGLRSTALEATTLDEDCVVVTVNLAEMVTCPG